MAREILILNIVVSGHSDYRLPSANLLLGSTTYGPLIMILKPQVSGFSIGH